MMLKIFTYKKCYQVFYKFLVLTMIMIPLNSCNTSYLDSLDEIDALSSKQTLSLEEKDMLYPAWNIRLRYLKNESDRAFTAEDKVVTLRIMSVVRFVINTPEYETRIINLTLKATENKNSQTMKPEQVRVGDILDSKRVLGAVRKTLLTTEISYANLDPSVVGLGTVPNYYPYFEDPNHKDYASIISDNNIGTWIKVSRLYDFVNTLRAYADIGNTILHETVHNLGFSHHESVSSGDVAYSIGNTFSSLLKDKDFLEKYQDEFKKLVPYFEEKYRHFIYAESAVTKSVVPLSVDTTYLNTRDSNGEPLTIIECIIEGSENYVKPFRYVVQNGRRTVDDFILK